MQKKNLDQKKSELSDRLHKFMQQYSRKKQAGQDPNDRAYDRQLEKEIKKMSPLELDSLLRFDGSEDNAP